MSLLVGAASNAGTGGYNLENSLRFRASAGAYLNRTPATAGNRKTWTWSCWFKRGSSGTYQIVTKGFADASNYDRIIFFTDNTLRVSSYIAGATSINLTTNALFRDPSSWYHIIVVIDTTQATASNRAKLFVNGEQASLSAATYPALNADTNYNNTILHSIGAEAEYSGTQPFDGYQTEINFVDGQALTPSDFGETNATTGVWQPAEYTGTYGTNGFYLPMNQTVEVYAADYLVVAGGGGGCDSNAGGGGAGGLLSGATNLAIGSTYTVTVGAGGAPGSPIASPGGNSVFNSLTAIGGGGSTYSGTSGSGGSGAGGGGQTGSGTGGAATAGQGNIGGNGGSGTAGGGGGGAGSAGVAAASGNGGNGGSAGTSSITGTTIYYAGGGGGGARNSGAAGLGGGTATTANKGGAGDGGTGGSGTWDGTAGTANTGGGGGAGAGQSGVGNGAGAAGGSGVVILRVPTANYTGTVTGSPTVTTDGSYKVVKFTVDGSYTA